MTEITQADRDAADALRDKSPIRDYIRQEDMDQAFARHRMEERASIVAWLKKENGLCDCFARSESEGACGAWDDYKTVPIERIWQAIEVGEHLK